MALPEELPRKPANEDTSRSGSDCLRGERFSIGRRFFNPKANFVQVDIDSSKFGRRHNTDVSVLGDGITALNQWVTLGTERPADQWLAANQENIVRWHACAITLTPINKLLFVQTDLQRINRIAEPNAIFVSDVGNVTINSIRHLDMTGEQRFTTSGWFATMGNGVPGGIAAQLSFPDRQVFTLSGDGGFAMQMQDILTQVKYQLPIVNIVFSNDSFGFIEAEQEDTEQKKFGVFLEGADFGKVGEALGAKGYTITRYEDLTPAFDAAKTSNGPVVIDIKIENARPLPVEELKLDPEKFSAAEIAAFKRKITKSKKMPTLRELLKGN